MMTGASPSHASAFDLLVAPVPQAAFFAKYFEREMLHVARRDPAYFRDLYGVACVEDALVLGAADADRFATIKSDAFGQAATMTSERAAVRFRATRQASRRLIDPRSIVTAFADGYTLNIKDASAYHPPLARLCNEIQEQLGFYVHANVYFTPPDAQGFGIHYDTHDTLIVQIEGTKDWEVHAPVVPLPLETQPFSKSAHNGKLDAPRRIRLEAGDTLYIPHGFPHEAKTSGVRSLHITFALAAIRAVDLLDSLVQIAAFGDVELRRALPPGWHRDPAFAARFSAQLAKILPRAIAADRIPLAADFTYNELFAATRTTAAGMFDTLAAFAALGPTSIVELRRDTPFQLRNRADCLHVVLAAKVVKLPIDAGPAIMLLQKGAMTFAGLERLLAPATATSFVRTLALEGLIDIRSAQPANDAARSNDGAVRTERRVLASL